MSAIGCRFHGLRVCLLLVTSATLLVACLPQVEGTQTQVASGAPLSIPANLIATGGDMRVTLTWSASAGATAYLVKRAGSVDTDFAVLASVTAPTYTDSRVFNGATYRYVVSALGATERSGDTPPATATPQVTPSTGSAGPGPALVSLPGAPSSLSANGDDARATLTWTRATGATSYVVKRSTTEGGPYRMVAATTATSHLDLRLTNGTTYYYVINAVNGAGAGADSNEASALPLIPPLAPANLQAVPGNGSVDLSWNASELAASYVVKRALASGGPYTEVGTALVTTYTDAPLANGRRYYYVVAAVNAKGTSPNSLPASARPEYCIDRPAPGVWQDVTPASATPAMAVNGTVAASLLIDPFDAWKVWLGTGEQNQEIWQSGDCASTWTRVNTGAGGSGPDSVGEGSQWSMQADFATPDVLFATSGNAAGGLWKTVDGGQSWTDMLAGTAYADAAADRSVNNISLDATNPLHLAVTSYGACTAPYEPSCIAETLDGGLTWRVVPAPEPWREGGGLLIVSGGHWLWCGEGIKLTTDAGATWSDALLPGEGSCEAQHTTRPLQRAANGRYYLGSRDGVLSSTDGEAWQRVPGTSGPMEAIALGPDRIFAASQSQPALKWALLADEQVWTDLPAPDQLALGTDGGMPFIAYDEVHRVLYVAMLSGGVARIAF